MMSQKEVGIEVLAITAPFQNCISKKGSDTINDITYIRTSQNTKNSISDQRKSVLKRGAACLRYCIFHPTALQGY